MITVFKMLFGKNAKIGNRLADKESFLSFCLQMTDHSHYS